MRRTIVYALMLMLGVTAVLSSCSNETELYDPTAADQLQHNKFKEAFEQAFGKVNPNVDWGFNDNEAVTTRGITRATELTNEQICALTVNQILALSENAKRTYLRQLVETDVNIGNALTIRQLDAFGFKRIICEDLAVSEKSDFDYNDAVFDAKRMEEEDANGKTTFYIILRAEGAHKTIVVGNDEGAFEVHAAFDVTKKVFVNTVGKPRPIDTGAYWKRDHDPVVKVIKVNKKSATLIDIPIYAEGNALPLKAVKGEPAEKMCVDLDYSWVEEREHMGSEKWYPTFKHYVSAQNTPDGSDAYNSQLSWWRIAESEWDSEVRYESDEILTVNEETFGATIGVHYYGHEGTSKGKGTIYLTTAPTQVGYVAFNGNDNLISIELPEGIASIGEYAFYNCTSLKTIEMPSSLKEIKKCAFIACESLRTIICWATTPPTIGYSAFQHLIPETILVPSKSVEAYKTADGWSEFASKIQAIVTE